MRQPRDHYINTDTRVDMPYVPDERSDQINRRSFRKKAPLSAFIVMGIIGILIIIGVAAASWKQFRHQLALSIVRQPTPYTQLYFDHPVTLSDNLKVDAKNTFEFTIENDENRTYRYTYSVTLDDSRSHLVVTTQTVTIDNGVSVTRPVTVVPKDRKSKYLISITLEGMNQSIHFYSETS